ncbi:MAG TPA: hypothetical protein VHZ54_10375 [Solirubrobacterales bacterium]|jgi:hypothetical protein|nr:hypothetical protein [Solirubrobacterales bacterium]
MPPRGRTLELTLVAGGIADRERATLLADRLGARRPLTGESPTWQVRYEGLGTTEAMALCEAELDELGPGWFEVLDFRALPSRPMSEAEFG